MRRALRVRVSDVADALKERTMCFALRVVRFCRTLPETWECRYVRDQLFRAAASGSANYHASCRARSRREFIAKLGIVVEESDEAAFWLEFAKRSGMSNSSELQPLSR